MAQTITGTIENIIFRKTENMYTVLELDRDGIPEKVTGYFPNVKEGLEASFTGEYVTHPRFGEQFNAASMEIILGSDENSIMKFLSSGMIKGIGKKKARDIVDVFGEDTLSVLEKDPMLLTRVSGIGKKTAYEASKAFREQKELSRIIMELSKYSITPNFARKLYLQYGEKTIATIQQNPYALIDEVYGIGFKKADQIAMNVGVDRMSPYRLECAVKYVMDSMYLSGDTYIYLEDLIEEGSKLIEVSPEAVHNALPHLLLTGRLIMEKEEETGRERYYCDYMYNSEYNAALNLARINRTKSTIHYIDYDFYLDQFERDNEIKLNDEQKSAVIKAVSEKTSIITGGPGTGKTTIINAIIYVLRKAGKNFMLAAPTGKAAKRMSESTGEDAKTIHRLLEYEYSPDNNMFIVFAKNEDNRLDTDYLIIDEMSMTDAMLFDSLLKAVKETTSLIFVGDADQLPSVGAGNVLHDIIESGCFSVSRLKTIYRQKKESLIKTNAARINAGQMPEFNNCEDSDFYYIDINTQEKIRQRIVKILLNYKNSPLADYDVINDFQIISALKRGAAGVIELNRTCQEILNPPSTSKREMVQGSRPLREGDKVMQIRNNYNIEWTNIHTLEGGKGLFNGDSGVIRSIYKDLDFVEILFDEDKLVNYPKDLLQEVSLSYAITIHKSQGNEFGAVIIPVYHGYPAFMTRNLLYTALTRAKKLAIIIGEPATFRFMIRNEQKTKRRTSLEEKIRAFHELEERDMQV